VHIWRSLFWKNDAEQLHFRSTPSIELKLLALVCWSRVFSAAALPAGDRAMGTGWRAWLCAPGVVPGFERRRMGVLG
jgi:hypothetical protein